MAISYIIFSQIYCRFQIWKSKYNQKLSLGSGYVNNRTFWLRSDLIFLIMKEYSNGLYLSAFVSRGIKICIVFFICMFYFRKWKVIKFTVYLFNNKCIKSAVIVMQCSGISYNFPTVSEGTWCVGNVSN